MIPFFFLSLTPSFSLFNTVVVSLPQASQPDELTIDEQEMLEVIEDGDMEDWVKVRKYTHTCALYLQLQQQKHYLMSSVRSVLCVCSIWFHSLVWCSVISCHVCFHAAFVNALHCLCVCVCVFQARNKTGHVGYVPEKYLQFPTSNSLLSMLQSLATLDARSHTSSNSTEPELHSNCINGDTNSKCAVNQASGKLFFEMIKLHARSLSKTSKFQLYKCK